MWTILRYANRAFGLREALAKFNGTTKFVNVGGNIGLLKKKPKFWITIPASITTNVNAKGLDCGVNIEETPDIITDKSWCLVSADLSKASKFANPIGRCVLAISGAGCYRR